MKSPVTKKILTWFAGASLALVATLAAAEPGYLWENGMEMSAMGMKMPMQTTQTCQPKEWREPPGAQQDSDCKMLELKQSPSRISWKVKCTGKNAASGSGEINFQGDTRYSGVIRMTTREGESVMNLNGKRLGACDYSKPKAPQIADTPKLMGQQCQEAVDKLNAAVFLRSDMCKSHKQAFCNRMGSIDGVEKAARDGSASLQEIAAMCGKNAEGWCIQAGATDRLEFVAKHCPTQKQELVQKHCEGRDYTALMSSEYAGFCRGQVARPARAAAEGQAPSTDELVDANPAKAAEAIGQGVQKLKGMFGW